MQGFKKEKNSLVLCSLIRIFADMKQRTEEEYYSESRRLRDETTKVITHESVYGISLSEWLSMRGIRMSGDCP